ncbi:outer membrane lipoprotein-sorting protein [Kordia periserrulae]|uniref:Outer membrane lipoprotein-sorting protein n=1 Tax=Kordia periserrulae TaxID=701523 RepID=A0A2T6C253_9FLAO|nr:outer membrane lipoprotein carrier protein LolA [Kordia periserrulae]PTX62378.1 outer membrane lipoprotein-sorting protein [Kordia periserrulae]
MKKLVLVLVLGIFTCTVNAQNTAKAKKLLDEVSAKVNSYENIQIDFKYELNNKEANTKQESKGNVTLEGEKYYLNFLGFTKLYDTKKVYTIVPANEEVTISDVEDDETGLSPSEMLTFYKKGYTYAWDILQNVRGRKIQYIKLTPTSPTSDIKNVLLGIDEKTKHIYNLIETGKNGTITTLTVNSFKTNQPLSKSLFIFDESKYEDYYIDKN